MADEGDELIKKLESSELPLEMALRLLVREARRRLGDEGAKNWLTERAQNSAGLKEFLAANGEGAVRQIIERALTEVRDQERQERLESN
jgi:hypothetical protein